MADSYAKILKDGLVTENPVFRQVLGICSSLAVTNLVANTLYMGFGVTFATALTSYTISALRNYIPMRVRMIVQVIIIAVYVMVVEILIKALAPEIHRFIGPYVGLIITNCIIMGRAEAFASQNKPLPSLVDGLACGLGYTAVLVAIAVVREIMGFGTVMGHVLPARDLWWHQWTIMVMPPGAFFMLAIMTWAARARLIKQEKK
jgi:Na+-transporting NADH:ubiquinone oxidoreductase subunit D